MLRLGCTVLVVGLLAAPCFSSAKEVVFEQMFPAIDNVSGRFLVPYKHTVSLLSLGPDVEIEDFVGQDLFASIYFNWTALICTQGPETPSVKFNGLDGFFAEQIALKLEEFDLSLQITFGQTACYTRESVSLNATVRLSSSDSNKVLLFPVAFNLRQSPYLGSFVRVDSSLSPLEPTSLTLTSLFDFDILPETAGILLSFPYLATDNLLRKPNPFTSFSPTQCNFLIKGPSVIHARNCSFQETSAYFWNFSEPLPLNKNVSLELTNFLPPVANTTQPSCSVFFSHQHPDQEILWNQNFDLPVSRLPLRVTDLTVSNSSIFASNVSISFSVGFSKKYFLLPGFKVRFVFPPIFLSNDTVSIDFWDQDAFSWSGGQVMRCPEKCFYNVRDPIDLNQGLVLRLHLSSLSPFPGVFAPEIEIEDDAQTSIFKSTLPEILLVQDRLNNFSLEQTADVAGQLTDINIQFNNVQTLLNKKNLQIKFSFSNSCIFSDSFTMYFQGSPISHDRLAFARDDRTWSVSIDSLFNAENYSYKISNCLLTKDRARESFVNISISSGSTSLYTQTHPISVRSLLAAGPSVSFSQNSTHLFFELQTQLSDKIVKPVNLTVVNPLDRRFLRFCFFSDGFQSLVGSCADSDQTSEKPSSVIRAKIADQGYLADRTFSVSYCFQKQSNFYKVDQSQTLVFSSAEPIRVVQSLQAGVGPDDLFLEKHLYKPSLSCNLNCALCSPDFICEKCENGFLYDFQTGICVSMVGDVSQEENIVPLFLISLSRTEFIDKILFAIFFSLFLQAIVVLVILKLAFRKRVNIWKVYTDLFSFLHSLMFLSYCPFFLAFLGTSGVWLPAIYFGLLSANLLLSFVLVLMMIRHNCASQTDQPHKRFLVHTLGFLSPSIYLLVDYGKKFGTVAQQPYLDMASLNPMKAKMHFRIQLFNFVAQTFFGFFLLVSFSVTKAVYFSQLLNGLFCVGSLILFIRSQITAKTYFYKTFVSDSPNQTFKDSGSASEPGTSFQSSTEERLTDQPAEAEAIEVSSHSKSNILVTLNDIN